MRIVYQVDTFTDRLLAGNSACVVLDAQGLDDAAMLAVARELGASHTAFLTAPTQPGATHRVRFFTAAREVAISGHAAIAAFFVLAVLGLVERDAAMECKAGQMPVVVERDPAGRPARLTLTLGKATFADAPLRGVVSQSVNLPPDVIAAKPSPGLVGLGSWTAILPVTDVDVLAHCTPFPQRIGSLGGTRGVEGIYVVALGSEAGPVSRVRARFFGAAGLGIAEDAATGVAAGALAAWLAKLGRLAIGDDLLVEQGVECGRPSTITARAGAEGRPQVGGAAVLAFETKLDV
jgi:trans-2,3-dihydro-3-hydroxyanthranilate isomerase